MTINLRHRSLLAATGALVVLAAASIVRPLPWPIWAAWALLALVGIGQAVRDRG